MVNAIQEHTEESITHTVFRIEGIETSRLLEILLKEGFDLNAKVSNKGDIWTVSDNERKMVISLSKKVTQADVEKLGLKEDYTFVCFDSALDDTTKVNIVRNFNVKVI